jgi:dienelactone hydrolase
MFSNAGLAVLVRRGLVGGALLLGAVSAGCADTDPTLAEMPSDELAQQGGGMARGADPTPASLLARRGPYQVQRYTNGMRNGPAYADATMNFPVDAEPPFAAIAIVPGFVSPQSSIGNWGPFLASHGIVAMTIGTNTLFDQPPARERALLDAIETIKAENRRAGGPLYQKLDLSRLAVGGWSMGGGGTLNAIQANPELKAGMAMCPWNPGVPYSRIRVPVLLFSGTLDALAAGQGPGFYRSIPESTPKVSWEVAGADHFYANDPAGQGGWVGAYGLAFLKTFLEGDERYRQFLSVRGPNSATSMSNVR